MASASSDNHHLQSRCTILEAKLSEGKEALNAICEVMKSLEKNPKTAKDRVKEQKENILNYVAEKLDERIERMNEETNLEYDELHRALRQQRKEINDYIDKVQDSVSMLTDLLKRGSIEEISSSQKEIDENIEKLENEQPENLAPVNDGDIPYEPEDVSGINVEELVDRLGCIGYVIVPENLRSSSSILQGDIAFARKLEKWSGGKCKWNLCYRASRDGWGSYDFHRYCDNKGPTVVLVKANDCIFGGYADQGWEEPEGRNDYKQSSSSFLFSLRDKRYLAPFIANIQEGKEKYAMYCSYSYGPVFGRGDDLAISHNPHTNESRSNFGNTYQLPPRNLYNTEQARNVLAGQFKFLTTEIEVFN